MPFVRILLSKTPSLSGVPSVGQLLAVASHKHSAPCLLLLPQRGLKTTTTHSYGSPLTDPENKGRRQPGTNFDQLGSWNNRLELKVNIDQSIKLGRLIPEIAKENIGDATLLGRRKDNEDRFVAEQLTENVLMFGVYDGHGGSAAVIYVRKHMEEHLKFWLVEKKEHDLSVVLTNAFTDCNAMFTKYLYHHKIGDDASVSSGTTATVCLVRNGIELAVANVGDSRGVLCREGKALRLTKDHSPDDVSEMKRIKECGGRVIWTSLGRPRVNGRLEMTRSIGDVELKRFGVICEPEIRSLEISHSKDAFIVLCTDGVHFVLSNQEMVDIVGSCKEPHEGARQLTEQALLFGSEDNCTALVVPFGSWGKFSPNKLQFGFSRNMVGGRYS